MAAIAWLPTSRRNMLGRCDATRIGYNAITQSSRAAPHWRSLARTGQKRLMVTSATEERGGIAWLRCRSQSLADGRPGTPRQIESILQLEDTVV